MISYTELDGKWSHVNRRSSALKAVEKPCCSGLDSKIQKSTSVNLNPQNSHQRGEELFVGRLGIRIRQRQRDLRIIS